jgi:hypothetical protein
MSQIARRPALRGANCRISRENPARARAKLGNKDEKLIENLKTERKDDPNPMATDLQIKTNRENALKSTGPKTPEGKQRSARNATRHGLLARSVVLEGEVLDRFTALLDSLKTLFEPRNCVETALVENMAVARWRQLRLWGMERAGMAEEMEKQALRETNAANNGNPAGADGIAAHNPANAHNPSTAGNEPNAPISANPSPTRTHDAPARSALAFRTLCDNSRSLDVLNRYETRFERQYLRALDRLEKMRKNSDFSKRTQFPDGPLSEINHLSEEGTF